MTEPLIELRRLYPRAGIALGFIVVALVLGSMRTSDGLDGPRVVLVALGTIGVGSVLARRPDLPAAWAIAVAGGLLGYVALPASWDSFRLLAGVLTAVALVGLMVVLLPLRWRLRAATLLVVLHLGGIVTAITGEGDQPWLFAQMWARVYRPYLQFTNQNTAYHFFAPNPGAPSELWFGIEYDTPDAARRFAWVVVPKRSDSHDPLWNSYYRRLKIPEYASNASELSNPLAAELEEFASLRDPPERDANYIPHHPLQPAARQLLIPSPATQHLVLPSFVRHVALENQRPGSPIKSIRVYRVVHDYIFPEHFVGAPDDKGKPNRQVGPFDPTTYLPYYLGTFDAQGVPRPGPDALRWWMIPILARPDAPLDAVRFRSLADSDYERSFVDHVKRHAGSDGYRKGP